MVGNPVLQEWVEIPPPPEPCEATGLVTHVEDDGVVSSFKVVRTCQSKYRQVNVWRVCVYSSDTGKWIFKRRVSSHHVSLKLAISPPSMNLNGMIYVWVRDLDPTEPGVLVSHDFYGPEADDHCRVIPLSVPALNNKLVRRCLTTSGGHVFLVRVQVLYHTLNVWKLNHNSGSSEWWQLSGEEINLESGDCYPMAMNPFDSDIVYLWSPLHGCLVSVNLRTKESEICGSNEGCCVVNTLPSKEYMEGGHDITSLIMLSQFVLPQWMDQL
uniref:F-box protein n=1 Tax=Noccaea caerulescens TaxID=107243 RepID=A0A1J3HYA4_NOCCA